MKLSARFTVPELSVAHQELDEDVVIVHLTRGHYYSLTASGAVVWMALSGGASIEEIVAAMAPRCGEPEERISETVIGFVKALLAETLIEAAGADAADRGGVASIAGGEPVALTPMAWEKFTDLEQLLLVDPIHEVDEAGWPPRA